MKKTFLNLKRAYLKQKGILRVLTKHVPHSFLISIKTRHAIVVTRRTKTTELLHQLKEKVKTPRRMSNTRAKAEGAKVNQRQVPLPPRVHSGATTAKSLLTLPTIAGRR
jgi:hypothetical protein